LFLIANEDAGDGRGREALDRIRPLLSQDDVVAVTMSAGDARVLAARAAARGHNLIVALGGDGTVNEVVNGIAAAGSGTTLGIIPGGSGNDFAWTLGIPADPVDALAVLRTSVARRIDIGLLTFPSGATRRYVNTFGLGASGHVAKLALAHGRRGGAYAYAIELLRMMFSAKPWQFTISTGGETVCTRAIYAQLANGRREGRVFTVAPDAELDDGLLDMLVVIDVPLIRRPLFVVRGASGRLPLGPTVLRRQISAATITPAEALPCHVDGEPFTLEAGEEVRVGVLPKGLTVIAPLTSGR
jgi:YegS/Rv2252/BmrU family lipid kinase